METESELRNHVIWQAAPQHFAAFNVSQTVRGCFRPSLDAGRGLNICSPSYTLKPNRTVDPTCILNLSMNYNDYCILITRNINFYRVLEFIDFFN